MFERDYLMRLIMQLVEAIQRSFQLADEDKDPAAAADLLEGAIGTAVDMDSGVFLSLAPDSLADVLRVSSDGAQMAEYVGRSLRLEANYLVAAGNVERAALRLDQAQALADSFGFSLDEETGPQAAMEAFLADDTVSEAEESEELGGARGAESEEAK
ncbi:hypothetical protein Ccur_12830 [Cryptobacterium curtum DSM 15641]|uniref:Uncharacterized protein n=1 Tax=Cryptobacterium curtum (strain ATCC 700683 / DSM 15641 / CCUG 43107 / 12-3) TaxID=469378 RepID=C7ML14_CRYCD|nr:hypothetical protein [Cryptobacterium curtum]ACU94961.1 hypothetical protein Ccur_12830 [Cryptobacterium curtum DSM 15641]